MKQSQPERAKLRQVEAAYNTNLKLKNEATLPTTLEEAVDPELVKSDAIKNETLSKVADDVGLKRTTYTKIESIVDRADITHVIKIRKCKPMTKEKLIDFEAIATRTRKVALEQAQEEIDEDPLEFKDCSKKEIELYLNIESGRFVREAEIYSENVMFQVRGAKNVKDRNPNVFNNVYGQMVEKVLFVMKGEKYTTETQGALCALMEVSPRHYRDVREKYKEQLEDKIEDDITMHTQHELLNYTDKERDGLNRVLHEMSLIGLPCITEWSNNEATEGQEQAILKAIEGANAISNSTEWQKCSVFEWYVAMSPDERVSNGCKV